MFLPRVLATSLILLVCAGLAAPIRAQDAGESQAATRQRLESLRKQIQSYEKRLENTAQKEEATQEALQEVSREIKIRQELINTYRTRINQMQDRRQALEQSLDELKNRLTELREEYRRRVVHAYKYGRLNDLALVLSAESINQAFIRIKYLRQFALERERKRREIRQTADQLSEKQKGLQETIQRNKELLAESQREHEKLVDLKSERRQLIQELRQRQKSIRSKQADLQQKARNLEQRLEKLAAAEARRREEAGSAAENRALKLSGSFKQNKGSLPWPADGVLTSEYGTQVHPVHGTRTINPGIEIATTAEAEVRTVFQGTVNQVFVMAGYGTCMTIRHGTFITVYCNLSSLYVREGDQVQAGQRIGRAGSEEDPLGTALFFGLFTENGHADPLPWLRSR